MSQISCLRGLKNCPVVPATLHQHAPRTNESRSEPAGTVARMLFFSFLRLLFHFLDIEGGRARGGAALSQTPTADDKVKITGIDGYSCPLRRALPLAGKAVVQQGGCQHILGRSSTALQIPYITTSRQQRGSRLSDSVQVLATPSPNTFLHVGLNKP